MFQYNSEVLEVLKEFGWSADRRIDTRVYEAKCAHLGIATVDCALEFLRQYADLHFQLGRVIKNRHVYSWFGYSIELPDRAVDVEYLIDSCRVNASWVGRPVMRIGYNCGGETQLYMDTSGAVYEDCESLIYFCGASGEEVTQRYILGLDHIREITGCPP